MSNSYKQTAVGRIPKEWEVVRLGDVFQRVTRKNTVNSDNVLTISAQNGLIKQENFFTKSVASKDLSNYILLEKGEFAYNKSYSSGYPMGATKRLNLYNYGVLSNLYIYFKIKNGNSDFYEQYFEAGLLNKEIHQIAQEGARNHGLLNIFVVDFFNILIALPPLKEQEKIADILSTWDMAISNLDELIIQKQKLKTALMQNLLSAKIRFKEFTAPWQEVKLGDILDYEQPTKYIVNNVAYVNDMYKIPVLTAGKSFILGYTDETNGIYDKLPVILFDDFTTDTKFVNFKFKVKSSAIKLLKPKDKTATILKIIYETMELIKFSTEDHKRYWISEYQYL
ncbi:restriction endonuclease subunit S [Campylobacter fetus]|uniref:restriction endonuclease subunit S n=1 Tax=Campylobacter fetus TaxID=196 RepID=UPI001F263273|nr:restriction endonuclease subunit S [Campylobacter fetus]